MPPTVSIITPSFNQGNFIGQTIDSVLEQDYPSIEYIVVDGGSTDNTHDILKQYEDRIQWISEPDSGQANAINKGFGMASGEILFWLNSDDILLPGAVSRVMACFRENPAAGLVYGQCRYIDECGEVVGRFPTEPFDFKRLAMFTFIPQPSTFFRRTAYEASGGLDETLRYSLDFDLWVKITRSHTAVYLPEILSAYRLHGDSKTFDTKQAIENSKESLDIVYKHYNWAPANKVYGYCYNTIEPRFSKILSSPKPLAILATLFISTFKYLQMNKGFRAADLKALNWEYIRKIGVSWNDLYKTY